MRIVHAITSVDLRLGGTARAVIDLAEAMAARGHEVTVITENDVNVEQWAQAQPKRPRSLVDKNLKPIFSARRPSSETMRTLRTADVVHVHAMWEPFNLRVAACCRAVGVPYVVTPHGMLDDWCMAQKPWKKRLHLALHGRAFLEGAASVHCTAAAELQQSAKWFPRGRGRVVPNLMDLKAFEVLPGIEEAVAAFPEISQHAVRLLFLSRVSPKKGVQHLVDAVAQLVHDGVDAVALIAGGADADYRVALDARAQKLGITHRIVYLGHVGGTLKLSLIQACDMMVIPSSQENFGFVFFESLAAGTPVVTTELVDTRDELRGSGGAVIVQQNGAAVSAGIREVMRRREPHAADPMRMDVARAWVFRELALDVVTAQFEAMYRDAASMRTTA